MPMRSMSFAGNCVEKDVGFSSDIYMNPTSRPAFRKVAAFPKKKMQKVDHAGSFVHCLLFTPNLIKFGYKSTLWTLPAWSTPGLDSKDNVYLYPHLVCRGEKRRERERECLLERGAQERWTGIET